MPQDLKSVINSDSLSGKKGVNHEDSPSNDDRSVEQIREENKRKAAEITELRESRDSAEERLAELEKTVRLTRAEMEEKARLERKVDTIDDKVNAILSNPESQPWVSLTKKLAKEETSSSVSKAIREYDLAQADKMVAKYAKANKGADGKPLDIKQLEKQLLKILDGGKWSDRMPTDRIEMALEVYEEQKSMQSELEQAREKAAFAEGSGHRSRDKAESVGLRKELDKAKESGSFKSVLSAVAERQAAQKR